MSSLQKLWVTLDGKKTYGTALATVLYAVFYYGINQRDYGTMVTLIFGSTGLGCLRHGVAKAQ